MKTAMGTAIVLASLVWYSGRATGQTPGPESIPFQSSLDSLGRPVVAAPHNFARWEKEIAAFEALDRENLPPPGGILFIGSSTIRLWKTLETDYPGLPVLNRGFGGSEIADSTHFADRIIFPYAPKQIILRAGTNDIHEGRPPSEVARDFVEFVRTVRTRLPRTEILFIAANPAPSRWIENDKFDALNKTIRNLAIEMPHVGYIDAADIGLTPTGQARPELFVADRLHFSPEGYKLLAERVRPYLPVAR